MTAGMSKASIIESPAGNSGTEVVGVQPPPVQKWSIMLPLKSLGELPPTPIFWGTVKHWVGDVVEEELGIVTVMQAEASPEESVVKRSTGEV